MGYECKIILDSLNPYNGVRLTTLTATYPRIVHDERLRHRMLSCNAASTRAIPIAKQIQQVVDDPYIPETWGRNQKGMVAGAEIDDPEAARLSYLRARDAMVREAQFQASLGLHKEGISPLLMPFLWITEIITATEWANFLTLRCAEDARPPLRKIALMIRDALAASTPVEREWHIPYVAPEEYGGDVEKQLPSSVARCARVSYLNHEGQVATLEQDAALYARLVDAKPPHLSPTEHQAAAMFERAWSGNFYCWHQLRKGINGESGQERA